MSKINLNDDKYDVKNVEIFNNGKAGKAVGELKVWKNEEKEPGSTYPDWYLEVTNETGSINKGIYYPDENGEDYEKWAKITGQEIRHIFRAVFGDKELPIFETMKEAVDKVLSAVAKKNGHKVRVALTYGTRRKPKRYLQIRQFTPYIESADVSEDKSELKLDSNFDQLERLDDDVKSDTQDVSDFTGETIESTPSSNAEEDPF